MEMHNFNELVKESLKKDIWIKTETIGVLDTTIIYESPVKHLNGDTIQFIFEDNKIFVYVNGKQTTKINLGFWFSDIRRGIDLMKKNTECNFI